LALGSSNGMGTPCFCGKQRDYSTDSRCGQDELNMLMPHDLRHWITLCESTDSYDYYVHVSPIQNLRSILSKGLVPNANGGNYSGFEASLSGTYVTREPHLIKDHINARAMENGFILVLVQVPDAEGVIDEDAMHPLLLQCIEDVLKPLGLDPATASSKYDPEDDIWKNVVPCFMSRLGQPNEEVLRRNPDLVQEYVESIILDELYGADVDSLWYEDAKEQLIQAFPQISHPVYGNRYSLRLPAIGYSGPMHIVAVITVRNGVEKIVKGKIPPAAFRLIDACLEV
jgi:hypothetical protein